MKVYVVTIASDWDNDRGYVDSQVFPTREKAEEYATDARNKCYNQFSDDDDIVMEQYEDCEYYCYIGTEDEPEPSMGWERCVIKEREV